MAQLDRKSGAKVPTGAPGARPAKVPTRKNTQSPESSSQDQAGKMDTQESWHGRDCHHCLLVPLGKEKLSRLKRKKHLAVMGMGPKKQKVTSAESVSLAVASRSESDSASDD